MNMNILYTSCCILVIENYEKDLVYIINIHNDHALHKTQMVTINTMWYGLTNTDIEHAITELLENSGYDIEHEIELYRISSLYQELINNED